MFETMKNETEIIEKFGKRIQRCYGCFVAYYMKNMWLGEDASYYCENCKDDSMFPFTDFVQFLELEKLREVADEHHH